MRHCFFPTDKHPEFARIRRFPAGVGAPKSLSRAARGYLSAHDVLNHTVVVRNSSTGGFLGIWATNPGRKTRIPENRPSERPQDARNGLRMRFWSFATEWPSERTKMPSTAICPVCDAKLSILDVLSGRTRLDRHRKARQWLKSRSSRSRRGKHDRRACRRASSSSDPHVRPSTAPPRPGPPGFQDMP